MERLTYRRASDNAVCVLGLEKENTPEMLQAACDRLAEYEDTELNPEGIKALVEENRRLHQENFWLTHEREPEKGSESNEQL